MDATKLRNINGKSLFQDIPENLLDVAIDSRRNRDKSIQILLEKKKLPEQGWSESLITEFLNYLSSLDSNNSQKRCCMGEREGKVYSRLVRQINFQFSHGIGRSGNLVEYQPKAIGSTMLIQLTNALLLDLLHVCGLPCVSKTILVPMATGMTLMLCYLSIKKQRPSARYILWSRIDQKSCFKSIVNAGFEPIIIDTILHEDSTHGSRTNLDAFRQQVHKLGASNILCIQSTNSCFAPRNCDNLLDLSNIAKEFEIPHVVNNAYGLQSTWCNHQIKEAARCGRVDLIVQSTDKNLLVPVGGTILAGLDPQMVDKVAETYTGRASSSQAVNVLITLLEMGRTKYLDLMKERKAAFNLLKENLQELANQYNECVFDTPSNPISMAMTLSHFERTQISLIGSMLFKRGVSGARTIIMGDEKTIDDWGTHTSTNGIPYLAVAASIGVTNEEIDIFIEKLSKVLKTIRNKYKSSV